MLFLLEKLLSFYFKFSLLLQTLHSGITFNNPILREVEIVPGYRIGNEAYCSLPRRTAKKYFHKTLHTVDYGKYQNSPISPILPLPT